MQKMNKILAVIPVFALLLWGCSSSVSITDLSPEEHLKYALKLYEEEDYETAMREFESILLQYSGSTLVDDAQYYLGLTRYKRNEFIIAAYEFSKLIKNMPASPFVSNAQFMLAESYFGLSPNYNLDQVYTNKAISEYQAFIDFFPLDEKVPQAEEKIKELNLKLAEKNLSIANIYQKLSYYTASIKYYSIVVEKFHDTKFAPIALYNKILLQIDRENEKEALTDIKQFMLLYPDDENYAEVAELKKSLEEKISLN